MGYQTRVNTRYKQVGSNTYLDLPGIITESGLIVSHLKYLAHYDSRSLSWKKKSVTSLILLLKYIDVYQDKFNSPVKVKEPSITKALKTLPVYIGSQKNLRIQAI
jgi:hypothetical protein